MSCFRFYKTKILFLFLLVSLNSWSNDKEYDYYKQFISLGEQELESGL